MEPTDENRQIWDKVHQARHTVPPGTGHPGPVRHSLGDLTKKRVLHIRCGTGEATEELTQLGAVVTGVDPSEDELEVARGRAPSILWVHAEPHTLPRELKRERFELVYCAPGTLAETRDLDALARGIRNALRPGGDLDAVGWILMGVGLLGLLLSLFWWERIGPGYWGWHRRGYAYDDAPGPGYRGWGYGRRRTVVEDEGAAPPGPPGPPGPPDAPPPP